jgi:hypothetical protein
MAAPASSGGTSSDFAITISTLTWISGYPWGVAVPGAVDGSLDIHGSRHVQGDGAVDEQGRAGADIQSAIIIEAAG